MSWTKDRVEQLKTMWASGLSARQCAERLGGGVSRNSVISKIHREHAAGRVMLKADPGRQNHRRTRVVPSAPVATVGVVAAVAPDRSRPAERFVFGYRPVATTERQPPMLPESVEEIVVPRDQRRGLADIPESNCRWPIGDPQHEGFHFCHRTKVPGLPYCTDHMRRAYAVAEPRRTQAVRAPSRVSERVA